MDELDDLQFSLIFSHIVHSIPCTARYTSQSICDTANTPTLYHLSSRHVPTLHPTFDLPRNSLCCNPPFSRFLLVFPVASWTRTALNFCIYSQDT
jgi:hypothetical protein